MRAVCRLLTSKEFEKFVIAVEPLKMAIRHRFKTEE